MPSPESSEPIEHPRSPADEIAVLQKILLLHDGQLENFHPFPPPSAVRCFLTRATLPQLQGTLVELPAALRTRKQEHR